MSESWVINASPIILLAIAGLIELVPCLATRFVIPEPVAGEIMSVRGEDAAMRWLKGAGARFVHPRAAEVPEMSGAAIGAGERAVIAWAVAHRHFVAILDDHEARVAAQGLGIRVIGTVGVVLRLKTAGLIAEVKPHLMQIKYAGGYIGDELFREALQRAGETP